MSRPRNTEPQANGALARALSRRNPDWNDRTVHAERTHVIHQALQAMQALHGHGQEAGYSRRSSSPPTGDRGDGVRPCPNGRAGRDRQAGDELAQHRGGY